MFQNDGIQTSYEQNLLSAFGQNAVIKTFQMLKIFLTFRALACQRIYICYQIMNSVIRLCIFSDCNKSRPPLRLKVQADEITLINDKITFEFSKNRE